MPRAGATVRALLAAILPVAMGGAAAPGIGLSGNPAEPPRLAAELARPDRAAAPLAAARPLVRLAAALPSREPIPVPVMKPRRDGCEAIEIAAAIAADDRITAAATGNGLADDPSGVQFELELLAVEIARREIGRLEIDWQRRPDPATIAIGLVGTPERAPAREAVSLGRGLTALDQSRTWSKTERRLQLLQRQGNLQILLRDRQSGPAGQAVTFQASSRMLMPIHNADNTMAVDFQNLGVSIDLTPSALKDQVLQIGLDSQVNSVMRDGGVPQEGVRIPDVISNRDHLQVQMVEGQTLAVTNLFPDNATNNADLFPMLAELPIVGRLFQSRRFQSGQTELLLLITPYFERAELQTETVATCESAASVQ